MLAIALQYWIPPLLSVVIGGIMASFIVPRIQKRFEQNKSISARRLEISEAIVSALAKYVVNWKRLMQISRHEQDTGSLSDEQKTRKNLFVTERNLARDKLFEIVNISKIYFPDSINVVINDFLEWDEKHSISRLDDLPPIMEWINWQQRIISALRNEIVNGKRAVK
jgi:hypothetical protein